MVACGVPLKGCEPVGQAQKVDDGLEVIACFVPAAGLREKVEDVTGCGGGFAESGESSMGISGEVDASGVLGERGAAAQVIGGRSVIAAQRGVALTDGHKRAQ